MNVTRVLLLSIAVPFGISTACAPKPGPAVVKAAAKPAAAPLKAATAAALPSGVTRPAAQKLDEVSWAGSSGNAGALLGIASLSKGRAVAVGEPGVVWIDESGLRVAPLPDGIATSVWADGTDFAVAVGYGGLAYVWNGSAWSAAPTGTDVDLHAVWGRTTAGGREVFAGGTQGTVLMLDGAVWRRLKAPEDAVISAFAGAGGTLWAVGERSGTGEPVDGVVLRWDGNAFVDICPDIACGNAIYAAWAISATDLWTAGTGGELVRYSSGPPEYVATGTREDLTAIWGTGAADLFVAGDAGTCLHWDGKTWSAIDAGDRDLRAVDGLPSGEVWAVGEGGAVRHLPSPVPGG